MDYSLIKSGIKKLKEDHLSQHLGDVEKAKKLIEGVNEKVQEPYTVHHSLELMRRQIESSTKHIAFELNKLALLLENLTSEGVENFNDINNVLDRSN
jgi:hypothetical protein